MQSLAYRFVLFLIIVLISGCGIDVDEDEEDGPEIASQKKETTDPNTEHTTEIELPHIHGIGFTENGERAIIPAHDGLRVYDKGLWRRGEGALLDLMGFTMTSEGFYSSGYSSEQTDNNKPLGIIKSSDEGLTMDVLDLGGEISFQLMTAGYNSGAIYVINPHPNSRMEEIGMYRSVDEAKTWEHKKMTGLSGSIMAIAAHPDVEDIVAVSSDEGAFLSKDAGYTFEQVITGSPVHALSFAHDGHLLASQGSGREAQILMINLNGEIQPELPAPEVEEDDTIHYMAQNPQSPETWMLTTSDRDIFYTVDNGHSWQKLAETGLVISELAE